MANIAVIYGSVRSTRQGIKAVKFILNKLEERGHKVNLIDPLVYNLPLLDKMYKEYDDTNKPPEDLHKLRRIIFDSDAYVIVSAEYNHSIPPALSNLLDHFMEEYFFKPSAIVCYSAGPFGGVRAAMQLRAFLCEIGTPSIPSLFPISKVQDAFDENGKDITGDYERRVKKFLDEFEWYVKAFKSQRNKGTPY